MKELEEKIDKQMEKPQENRDMDIIRMNKELLEKLMDKLNVQYEIVMLESKVKELEDENERQMEKPEGKRNTDKVNYNKELLKKYRGKIMALMDARPLNSTSSPYSLSVPNVPDRVSALSSLYNSLPAPSSYAAQNDEWTPEKFDLLRHHRPHSRLSLPITLVHPVFNLFVDRIHSCCHYSLNVKIVNLLLMCVDRCLELFLMKALVPRIFHPF